MAAHCDGNGDGDGESEIFATHLLGHLACIDLPFGINKKSKQARAGPIINSNAANSNSSNSNSATATTTTNAITNNMQLGRLSLSYL